MQCDQVVLQKLTASLLTGNDVFVTEMSTAEG